MNKNMPKISLTGVRQVLRAKPLDMGRIRGQSLSFGPVPTQQASQKAAPKKIAVRHVYEQPEVLYDLEEDVPDVPLHAAAGLMAAPSGRVGGALNSYVPVLAGVCLLTFVLGMTAVMMWSNGADHAAMPSAFDQTQEQTNGTLSASAEPQLDDSVTRTSAPDLTDVTGRGHPAALSADLATAVLAGLQPRRTVADAGMLLDDNQFRMLREGVLARINTSEPEGKDGIEQVSLRTPDLTTATETFSGLFRQAAAESRIEIPSSLKTGDGDVDLDTMMFTLVQTSLANDGTAEGAAAALEMSRRIFTASTVKSRLIGGERIYIVETGDSLAYIALQFYGKPGAYQRILEANRDTLQSPEHIQGGQRLIIPS